MATKRYIPGGLFPGGNREYETHQTTAVNFYDDDTVTVW